jgi:predicted TIM-barrel fold metal-dependent hydrolase
VPANHFAALMEKPLAEGDGKMAIVDFRVRLRTEQMMKPWNPRNPAPYFEQYIKLYKMEPRLRVMSMEEFVRHMKRQGVSKGVVCGGSIEDNDHLMEIKEGKHGNNFYFMAGIHPTYGIRRNLNEIERCRGQGFLGVNLSPYIWGIEANSRVLYPIYAFCEEHKMVAIVHGSLHYNRFQSMWLGDPKYMDEIAIDFPRLKLVISHAGNGFGVLGLAVAQKHPNIFLEFSALWPEYLPDLTIRAVNSYLKERCLFGTDYPLVDFGEAIGSWKAALRPKVRELFFNKNAARCLFGDPE